MMYEHFNFEMKNSIKTTYKKNIYFRNDILYHLSYSNMHWKPVLYPLHIPTFCSSFLYTYIQEDYNNNGIVHPYMSVYGDGLTVTL